MTRWAVILAGGVGSRFWPLSTPSMPKQLLALVEDRPLLAGTLARLSSAVELQHTLVLTNASLVRATLQMVPELTERNIIAEPRPAGTAAALTWAAREILERDGPDAVMICVHADWFIGDEEEFRVVLLRAAEIARRHDSLVTVGVVPSRAEPGFGYIQPGAAVAGGDGACRAARFIEKPSREEAARMCASGFLWNSGIFAWRAERFLEEVRAHTPEVAGALQSCSDSESFFERVTPVSVDVGVLERSQRVMLLPGDFGWDDIGTWAALSRVVPLDEMGNAVRGRAALVAAKNNVVYAQDSQVVLYGVSDLVVVSCAGVTLVTTVELAADLKVLLSALPPELKDR